MPMWLPRMSLPRCQTFNHAAPAVGSTVADKPGVESDTHLPGAWAGDITLVADSFEYVGDGSGDVRLRIGPSAFNSGRFGGTIDNISVSNTVPEPSTLILAALALIGLAGCRWRRRR